MSGKIRKFYHSESGSLENVICVIAGYLCTIFTMFCLLTNVGSIVRFATKAVGGRPFTNCPLPSLPFLSLPIPFASFPNLPSCPSLFPTFSFPLPPSSPPSNSLGIWGSAIAPPERLYDFETSILYYCLECFDTVGWASGRASGP